MKAILEKKKAAPVFRCLMAVTLVLGLMLPSVGLLAYAEEAGGGSLLAALSFNDEAKDVAQDDETVLRPEEDISSGGISEEGSNDDLAADPCEEGVENSGSGQEDSSGSETRDTVSDPENTEGVEPTEPGAEGEGVSPVGLDGGDSPEVPEIDTNFEVYGADTVYQGLTISGGTVGTDFTTADGLITVLTSTPLTLSGTFSGSVHIAKNVSAHITLNGVNITSKVGAASTAGRSPINLDTPSTCYLTLADGTTNNLTATANYCAALHVGDGSKLYIDDARANWSGGAHVEVLNGVVDTTATLDDGTEVKKGDPVRKLKSANPGVLNAKGGQSCAAIGAGPSENAGNMVFDGGLIYAYSWGGHASNGGTNTNQGGSSGTGIGAGSAGGATEMTFNGAEVHAYGSYHGAGIGAGWASNGSSTTRQIGAATTTPNKTCGNININAGYLTAQGYEHGNAFGGACGTTANGKTIRVTGGTLLPSSYSGKYDLGGSGGYVVVTGGSLRVASMSKFQGNAYDSDEHDTVLTMVTIDLASEGLASNDITSWRLLVDSKPMVYGAPSMLDDGKLYLWLPTSYNGSDISVELSYIVKNADGTEKELKLEPLYVEDLGGNNGSTLKRYIDISSTKEKIDPAAKEVLEQYFDGLSKYYDGLPLPEIDFEANPISTQGLEASPKMLDKNKASDGTSYITTSFQTISADGEILEAGTTMPFETGTQAISIVSKQHAPKDASGSYWGHRIQGTATIFPVESKSSYTKYTVPASGGNAAVDITGPTWLQDQSENHNVATNNHLVVPVDVTSWKLPNGDTYEDGSDMSKPTSLAPYGKLQLFIDGRAVPERLGGVISFDRGDLEDPDQENLFITKDASDHNREHTVAIFDLTRSQLEAFGLSETEDGNHTVYVQYTSRRDSDADEENTARALADDELDANEYRNYYDSSTEETAVEIQRTDCSFDVYNLKGTSYKPSDTVKPSLSEDKKAKTVYYDITKETPGTQIPFYVDTNSVGAVTITSSNPGVLTFSPSEVKNRSDLFTSPDKEDFGFGSMATVRGAGRTTVTVTIAPTGSFKGATRTFDVYVYPNPDAVPVVTAVETAVNLTRSDGTIRPGDRLRYTVTFTNVTADSAYQNPVYTITVPNDARFVSASSTDAQGTTKQLSQEQGDYKRANARSLVSRMISVLAASDQADEAKDTLTVDTAPTLYGNQSYKLSIECVVDPSALVKDINDLDFRSDSTANGVYGINPGNNENYPWDDRIDNVHGVPLEEVTAWADPTSAEPTVSDILGGTLVDPAPGPDEPSDPSNPDDPDEPGVKVGPVKPNTPFADAEEADPDDPTQPSSPSKKEPIKDGDVITKFGDDDDPRSPEDIQKELDRIIKEAKDKDPNVPEVKIPVTIEEPNPDDPDNPIIKDVIVTVPVNPLTDPDEPDDHDLVVLPDDADPREGGDIVTSKRAVNATDGYGDRGNQNIAQVGDTIRYTIDVTNKRLGSAWYDVLVKDPLPEGLSYVPGTAVVTTADGTVHRDFKVDFDMTTRTIGFCLGDLYGTQTATVAFDCKVMPSALGFDVAANKAYVYGTEPSTTIVDPANPDKPVTPDKPTDPDNPDDKPLDPAKPTGPVEVKRDPVPPGPYFPEEKGTTWEDIDKKHTEDIIDIFDGDPANPPKLAVTPDAPIADIAPANPQPSALVTNKIAENLGDHGDGDHNVYVGDTLRYTVTFTNEDEPWTTWYGVTVEDTLPKGLVPISNTIKLTLPDGSTVECPNDVYSADEGNMAVYVGDVAGGQTITIVFDVEVTEEAANSDIGNVAFAYGRNPSDVDNSVIDGTVDGLPDRGQRYNPPEGWKKFKEDNAKNGSQSSTSYPVGYDPAKNRVVGSDDPSHPSSKKDGSDDKTDLLTRLAQTGDDLFGHAAPLVLLALVSTIVLAVSLHCQRARTRGRHVR